MTSSSAPTISESSAPTISESSAPTISQTMEVTATNTATLTTRYNAMPIVPPADVPSGPNYGMAGLGAGLGVIVSFVIIGAYYIVHKNNKNIQKPLSMRNIIYMGEHGQYSSQNPMSSRTVSAIVEEPTAPPATEYHYTKNIMDAPEKQSFEPVTIKDEPV
jgi:hypothetical protein